MYYYQACQQENQLTVCTFKSKNYNLTVLLIIAKCRVVAAKYYAKVETKPTNIIKKTYLKYCTNMQNEMIASGKHP